MRVLGRLCWAVTALPLGCPPVPATGGWHHGGAETPMGYKSQPPTKSLSGFVPLSRTIMSPAWPCPRLRMVGTGRAASGCTRQEHVGEHGRVLSSLD